MDNVVTEEHWNQLNNLNKKEFQEEVGKIYKENELPTYNDILIFCSNKRLNKDSSFLGPYDTPLSVEDFDKKWERVIKYFNKN